MSLSVVEAPASARAVDADLAARLTVFEQILLKWQPKMNLVAPSTLKSIRTRHIEDSLQVADISPEARRWVDLGPFPTRAWLIFRFRPPHRLKLMASMRTGIRTR